MSPMLYHPLPLALSIRMHTIASVCALSARKPSIRSSLLQFFLFHYYDYNMSTMHAYKKRYFKQMFRKLLFLVGNFISIHFFLSFSFFFLFSILHSLHHCCLLYSLLGVCMCWFFFYLGMLHSLLFFSGSSLHYTEQSTYIRRQSKHKCVYVFSGVVHESIHERKKYLESLLI